MVISFAKRIIRKVLEIASQCNANWSQSPLSRLKCLQKNPRKYDYPNNSSIHLDKQLMSSCLMPNQQNH
ncbi:hypothetical protein C5167_026091 [Papaver somniferum]|nr:hypothetical protein C5167_026091 [Papaver somniferum]